MASLKAYGKVNEADQEKLEAGRKSRKRITIISLSSIILVGVIVAAAVGTCAGKSKNGDSGTSSGLSTSIKAVCDVTLYPDSCYSSLAPLDHNSTDHQINPEQVFKLSVRVAMNELSRIVSQYFSPPHNEMSIDDVAALKSCRELLDLSLDHLNITSTTSWEDLITLQQEAVDDLKTWLSAAATYQETCIDGFENNLSTKATVFHYLRNSSEFTSNSLAIINALSNIANTLNIIPPGGQRRLMSVPVSVSNKDMPHPHWLSTTDRKLVESSNSILKNMKADAVVAKDGSGKYKTISDALKAVPDKSKKRFVIYVKKGIYNETVRIEKTKWNVMMVGDGMDATVVSGSLNVVDGTPTFQTATFAVFGKGFIGRDMGFRNTAGAIKHQAVALMSTADQSVFYRCRIEAFQDTLYVHSNRQFYRDCNIYGTVDFIFGNSAVILQNCNILPKRPMPGQQNTITAQGKFDPNQNTGISIQNCTIWPAANLSSVQTFLGRPWKNYSTTAYLQSMMGSLIDPKGWLPWTGNTAPDTIFYAEYQNFGAGSSTKNRVKWKGLRNLTSKQVNKFTVKSFIDGNKWISAAGVNYKPGL